MFILLMTAGSGLAWSLPTDKDQPINITAGKAARDEKQGLIVYENNVEIHQGTVVIKADTVTIKTVRTGSNAQEKIEEVIASGVPSHFQQQTDLKGNFVIAESATILYRVNEKMIYLIDNANVQQKGSTITGDRISYDVRAQRVIARGGSSTPDTPERVRVVIPVKKKTDPETTPSEH